MDRTILLILGVAVGALLALLLLWSGTDGGSGEERVPRSFDPITIEDASGVFEYAHLELDPELEQAGRSVRTPILATAAPSMFGQPFSRSSELEAVLSGLPPSVNMEHGAATLAATLSFSPELSKAAGGVATPLMVGHSNSLLAMPLLNPTDFRQQKGPIGPAILVEHARGLWWTGLMPPDIQE